MGGGGGGVRVKTDDVLHRALSYLYISSYARTLFGRAWYLKGTNISRQPLRCSQIIGVAHGHSPVVGC